MALAGKHCVRQCAPTRKICIKSPAPPRRRSVCQAAPRDPDAGTEAMSVEEAEQILQAKSTAGFDSILKAKNTQLAKSGTDAEKAFLIESAYDVLLMQSMRARMSGDMRVDNSVRFADVPSQKSVKQVQQSMLSKLPSSGVVVSLPPNDQLAILVASYSALAVWAFVQGATESYAAQSADVAGVQLALGGLGGAYFLRAKKRLGLPRACGYIVAGLILGGVVGNLVEGWLRVDIVPIFGMGSPGVMVGEFGLAGMAAAAILLA